MKRLSSALFGAALILGLTILLAIPNSADAFYSFRCGTKLVRIGDTKTDVEKSCGTSIAPRSLSRFFFLIIGEN